MDTALQEFTRQFAGVVAATLMPVIIVTFLWVPFTLGGHPGESRPISMQMAPSME